MGTPSEMWRRTIAATFSAAGVVFKERADSKDLIMSLRDRFVDPGEAGGQIFTGLTDYYSVQMRPYDAESTLDIIGYGPSPTPCLMLFDSIQFVFEFPSLEEAIRGWKRIRSSSDTYIFDKSTTFMLGFNDHDYLIGAGLAAEWIDDIHALTPAYPGPAGSQELLEIARSMPYQT